MRIALDQFPIAPTSNNLFPTVRIRGTMRRVKSGEYKAFEHKVDMWAIGRDEILANARRVLKPFIQPGWWIQTNLFFCMPVNSIFTKSKTAQHALQKWDACNRIKATHDALAKLIDIDDRHFAVGVAEKVMTEDQNQEPYTLIVLQPVKMVQEKQIIEEVLGWNKSTDRSILSPMECAT